MQKIALNAEAGQVSAALARRGIATGIRVHALVEVMDGEELLMAVLMQASGAFDWLAGEALTTWSVSQDGSRVRLGFADRDGEPCRIDLPMEAMSALLLTLPRILQCALDTCDDSSDRIVHPLGGWRLERAAEHGRLILTLKTPGGFGVAFTLAPDELAAMAGAGQEHSCTPLAPRVLN